MNLSDIAFVFQWWLVFLIIGIIFLPLTSRIFSNFFDKGYIFSKILGISLISYLVFLLGILKVAPFTEITIFIIVFAFLILNFLISKFSQKATTFEEPVPVTSRVTRQRPRLLRGGTWKIFLFEEFLFLTTLFFWSYIRAHQPAIQGLEKYMDFGFVNTILRTEYFPPVDMWFPPLPINYYYFGHLATAVLTKISAIPSFVTYNLMLATLFAFTFTGAFSIGANLIYILNSKRGVTRVERTERSEGVRLLDRRGRAPDDNTAGPRAIIAGLLAGFLASMAGNLHTIYAFFEPYVVENPVPFWQLPFAFDFFPNGYWYPNATRFIYNTIHEFPIYSSVVSDLHGHYLDVPFVLLTIAVLFSLILNFANKISSIQNSKFKIQSYNSKLKTLNSKLQLLTFNFGLLTLLLAFLLAVMYMTNAWDGIIYFLLTILVLVSIYLLPGKLTSNTEHQISNIKNQKYNLKFKIENLKLKIISLFFSVSIVAIGFFIFSLPFNLHFKPFASGIGILCAPQFLTNIGNIGPFLFEADHCQHSPWWQLLILYGFFYFWAISFIIMLFKIKNSREAGSGSARQKFKNSNFIEKLELKIENLNPSDLFVLLLIVFSTFLIILPEFIYAKDIYPGHYRANTMFKLGYQAFIMLSIASGYIIVRLISNFKHQISNWKFVYWVIGSIGLLLVSVYPYFAIKSYYGELKIYHGLDGLQYLKRLYSTDYEAILWINQNIKNQPVILEAQGDSYTDYGRVSTNTGLPTVLGWPVHEWLWRGSYDIPSPRIPEVQAMYESNNLEETKNLLKKHNVSLVFFGDLERQKYPNLNEDKFKTLGKVINENGRTKIYELTEL